jgi:hypothetical protein
MGENYDMKKTKQIRLKEISSRMRELNAELEGLQMQAECCVEEIENDFDGVKLPSEDKARFRTLRRLITKV